MCKLYRMMKVLAIFIAVATIGSGCTKKDTQEEDAKILVIKDSVIDVEQSSSDVKIHACKTFEEFEKVMDEIDTFNMQFAPEGYSGTMYDENCVVVNITHVASFTLDAEHMMAIAQYQNYLYIQYDSVDSAMKEIIKINEANGKVLIANQNKWQLYNYEETC